MARCRPNRRNALLIPARPRELAHNGHRSAVRLEVPGVPAPNVRITSHDFPDETASNGPVDEAKLTQRAAEKSARKLVSDMIRICYQADLARMDGEEAPDAWHPRRFAHMLGQIEHPMATITKSRKSKSRSRRSSGAASET